MNWFKAAAACTAAFSLASCSQTTPFTPPIPAALITTNACPAALKDTQDVVAPIRHGDQLLNAQASPLTALICEYGGGLDGGASARHALAGRFRLTAAPAKELATAAAKISIGTSTTSNGCPADTGSVTVIAFGYRNAPPVDLWWHSTGCQTIDNGATEAQQVANDSFGDFQAVFAALTRGAS